MLDRQIDKARSSSVPAATATSGGVRCASNGQAESETFKFGHGGRRPGTGGPQPGSGRPRKPVIVVPPPRTMTGPPRWFVYQCHPQAERLATHEITLAGYRAYLPLIATRRRDRVIPTMFHRVLVTRFPGYGFVELAPHDPWVPICDMPGVVAILRGGDGRPCPVRSGEVELHQ